MSRRTLRAILAAGSLFATAAFAIAPNTPVYVRARDTRAYSRSDGTGKIVVLQPGTTRYLWQSHRGMWNELKTPQGKRVWVYGPNLSSKPPKLELIASRSDGKVGLTELSAADAIKGLGEGAQWYAGQLDESSGDRARRGVATAEAISFQVENPKGGAK